MTKQVISFSIIRFRLLYRTCGSGLILHRYRVQKKLSYTVTCIDWNKSSFWKISNFVGIDSSCNGTRKFVSIHCRGCTRVNERCRAELSQGAPSSSGRVFFPIQCDPQPRCWWNWCSDPLIPFTHAEVPLEKGKREECKGETQESLQTVAQGDRRGQRCGHECEYPCLHPSWSSSRHGNEAKRVSTLFNFLQWPDAIVAVLCSSFSFLCC